MAPEIVSVVIGAGGQDGYYLCRALARLGKTVKAVVRKKPAQDSSREFPNIEYVELDLLNPGALAETLHRLKADEVYHLAAVHGQAGTEYERIWPDLYGVNVGAFHEILEYARCCGRQVWVFYAGSCRVFGPLAGLVSERSPKAGTDLYAVSKKTAGGLADYYRDRHDIRVMSAYFFQHESPQRGADYFSSKIVSILRSALGDPSFRDQINGLDFFCDWGSAEEYMDLVAQASQLKLDGAFVFATGHTSYARDLVKRLFEEHQLNYENHIIELMPRDAATEAMGDSAPPFQADIRKLSASLGRRPEKAALDVFRDMVRGKSH